MRIQHRLPVADLSDALVAAQVFLDIGGSCWIVEFVPIGLNWPVIVLLLLSSAPAAFSSVIGSAVEVLVVFGGYPVG